MHTRFLSVKCTTLEVKQVSQSCESSSLNADPHPYPSFYFDADPDPDPNKDPDPTLKLGHKFEVHYTH
jgi:hypothetical protein